MLIFAGVGLICGAKRDSVMALFSGLYHMNNGTHPVLVTALVPHACDPAHVHANHANTHAHTRAHFRTGCMLFLNSFSHSSISVYMPAPSTILPIFSGYERERVGYSKVDQGYYHQGETQGTPMNQTHFREKVSLAFTPPPRTTPYPLLLPQIPLTPPQPLQFNDLPGESNLVKSPQTTTKRTQVVTPTNNAPPTPGQPRGKQFRNCFERNGRVNLLALGRGRGRGHRQSRWWERPGLVSEWRTEVPTLRTA
jgi:hypothetical protein